MKKIIKAFCKYQINIFIFLGIIIISRNIHEINDAISIITLLIISEVSAFSVAVLKNKKRR